MRIYLTAIAAIAILLGSYGMTFGVPAGIKASLGIDQAAVSDANRGPAGAPPNGARGGGPRGGNAASVTAVVVTPLEMQPYEDVLRAIGSASAWRSAYVVSDVSGEVIEINLPANQKVAAGDVLVQLDARTEVLNLEIAQAELTQARDTVQRYERLQLNGNSTITDVTLSDARVAQRLAEAAVGLAEVALEDRTLRAPIAGKLGLSEVEVGDILSAETVIVTIDDSQALEVEFELPERSIALLETGRTILASTPSLTGRIFEGEITSFDSRIDSVTRSVTVQARIENPDGLLWPGMTMSVRLIQQSDPLAVLPATAITWSRNGSNIWIERDGHAEPVAATILFRRGDRVWIDADVPMGTRVVTEGAQKLRAGTRIAAVQGPQEGGPQPASEIGEAETARPDRPGAPT